MNERAITYSCEFADNERAVFEVRFDSRTLLQAVNTSTEIPDWARLDFHQCPECPLVKETWPWCPVAVNLIPFINKFGGLASYDEAKIEVKTNERTYMAETTIQRGMSSFLGLVMATSACPHMGFLRPMASFHLPFASDEETIYRAVSTYLLLQYYKNNAGGKPDLELEGLGEIYRNLQNVNRAFAGRLSAACNQDAAVNAVILLDLFAKDIPYSIDEKLEELVYRFEPLFKH